MKKQVKTILNQLALVVSVLAGVFGMFFGVMQLLKPKNPEPAPVVYEEPVSVYDKPVIINQTMDMGGYTGTNIHIEKTITVHHED